MRLMISQLLKKKKKKKKKRGLHENLCPYESDILFQVSILPPLASIFITGIAAQFADHLISNGVEVTTVSGDTEPLLLSPYINQDFIGRNPIYLISLHFLSKSKRQSLTLICILLLLVANVIAAFDVNIVVDTFP
jgi:hypothetical protein